MIPPDRILTLNDALDYLRAVPEMKEAQKRLYYAALDKLSNLNARLELAEQEVEDLRSRVGVRFI